MSHPDLLKVTDRQADADIRANAPSATAPKVHLKWSPSTKHGCFFSWSGVPLCADADWKEPWQTRGMAADLNVRPETAIAATQSLLTRPHVTRRAGKTGKVHLCDEETLIPLCGRPLANGGLPCDAPVDCVSCRRRLAGRVRRPADPLLKDARERRRSNRRRRTAARS